MIHDRIPTKTTRAVLYARFPSAPGFASSHQTSTSTNASPSPSPTRVPIPIVPMLITSLLHIHTLYPNHALSSIQSGCTHGATSHRLPTPHAHAHAHALAMCPVSLVLSSHIMPKADILRCLAVQVPPVRAISASAVWAGVGWGAEGYPKMYGVHVIRKRTVYKVHWRRTAFR